MQFKSLFFSFFLALTLGFALLTQAEDTPRGPKITNKVGAFDLVPPDTVNTNTFERSISILSKMASPSVASSSVCTERLSHW